MVVNDVNKALIGYKVLFIKGLNASRFNHLFTNISGGSESTPGHNERYSTATKVGQINPGSSVVS